MPRPMSIRLEMSVFAPEGTRQSAIVGRVGLTGAAVNRILRRYAATGTLVPGKSMVASRKTTPRQDRALLRIVRQDRYKSGRALTAWL